MVIWRNKTAKVNCLMICYVDLWWIHVELDCFVHQLITGVPQLFVRVAYPPPRRPPRILTTNPKLCNLYTDTWNLLHWTHIFSNMINHVNNNMFIKCCLKIRRRRRRNIICLLSSIKISYISWYLTCKIPKISKCAILTVPKAFKNSINIAKIIYYGEIMMATKF